MAGAEPVIAAPRSGRMMFRTTLLGLALALAACDARQAEPSAPPSVAPQQVETTAPAAPAPTSHDLARSRDPRRVVIAWAKAMSMKDWDAAYRFWNEGGARSGMTIEQFRARWSKVADPQFDIAEGTAEGAAGSLYYTAPITLIDGPRRVRGEIVLRRANDVPGATAEQLRWHIERLDLQP